MSQIGLGVLIQMMGGDRASAEALKVAVGEEITGAAINGDELVISFAHGSLRIHDDGQSCCEHRHMSSDDDFSHLVGATFLGAELKDGPSDEADWETHEQQFLEIQTSKGCATIVNHNEHNGYYGGFYIAARWETA